VSKKFILEAIEQIAQSLRTKPLDTIQIFFKSEEFVDYIH
jgi:hypothetical protein